MRKRCIFGYYILICSLVLFVGCGAGLDGGQDMSVTSGTAGNSQENAGGQTAGYITVAEAKAIALDNAGLVEEDVRFVRVHLDSESESPSYDLEFISANMEYDYKLGAATGEILSMNCEAGDYDLGNVSQSTMQAVNNPSEAGTGAAQPGAGTETAQPETGAAMPETGVGNEEGQYIGLETARNIALEHAGQKEEEVRFLHAKLEFEDRVWQYDVEFYHPSLHMEYDYDIDALTGEILSFDYDAEYSPEGEDGSMAGDGQINEEKAKQIALEYAGVAEENTQRLEIKLDYDDGRAEYEIEWCVGRTEYSCDVDAVTGEVLSFEKEFD